MSMGQSKSERFKDQHGIVRVNRTPVKPLNLFVKASLLLTLNRDDIFVRENRRPGSDEYTAVDANGEEKFRFDNAWDYGYYVIYSGTGAILAEMDWYENDGNTNKQQQDIFDVLNKMIAKAGETQRIEEGRRNLTQEEFDALQSMGINMGRSM